MTSIYILLSSLTTSTGNLISKIWANNSKTSTLIGVIVLFTAATVFYLLALKGGKLTIINTIATALNIVLTVFLGYLVLHEKVTTLEWVGMGVTLAGVFLLSLAPLVK